MLGDSIRRRRRHLESAPPRPVGAAPRLRWSRWILSGLAAVLLSFGTGYVVAVQVLFPAPVEPVGDAAAAPRLTGKELTDAQAQVEALGLAVGRVRWLPHPEESAGTVIAQDPLPGQRLRPGAEVRLAVSSGRAQTAVPDVVGLPYELAAQLGRRLGFEVNRRTEVASGPEGVVLRVEPRPGTERVLPASITLIVSTKPPSVPESVPPPADAGGVGADVPGFPRAPGAIGGGSTRDRNTRG